MRVAVKIYPYWILKRLYISFDGECISTINLSILDFKVMD
nr:MAG TPA: hypothetical protein [Caudoviricetes sp.]DAG25310.1 MAG TPA: hypothetical protein [Caudoviricetes sp.]